MYFKYINTCPSHENKKVAEMKNIPYFLPVVYISVNNHIWGIQSQQLQTDMNTNNIYSIIVYQYIYIYCGYINSSPLVPH